MIPRVGDTADTLTVATTINQMRKTSYSKHCVPQTSMYIQLRTIYILGNYSWKIQAVNLINKDQRHKSPKHLYRLHTDVSLANYVQ